MNNKSKLLYKNTIIFFIGNIGSKLIQFLLVPLYTYTLTTSEFGQAELVITLSNILLPIFSFAIADGLLRFGLDCNYNKTFVLQSCLLIAAFGSIFSILLIFLVNFMYQISYVMFITIIMNLLVYNNLFAINLKINQKNKLYALNSILYTFILGVFSYFFLVILSYGIYGYFYSIILSNGVSIIFLLLTGLDKSFFSGFRFDYKFEKQLVIYCLPMILNAISWWIISASDKIAIEYFLGSSELGIYCVSTKMPTILVTLVGVFAQAWIISACFEFKNNGSNKFYADTFKDFYAVVFILTVILIAFIKPFMFLYVNENYMDSWFYAVVLIASVSFSSTSTFFDALFQAGKKTFSVMITITIGGITNILLNLIFIPILGLLGAVVSTYLSWFVVSSLRMYFVNKYIGFRINNKDFFLCELIILVESIFTMILDYVYFNIVGLLFIFIAFWVKKDFISKCYSTLAVRKN